MPESAPLIVDRWTFWPMAVGQERDAMAEPLEPKSAPAKLSGATRRSAVGLILGAPLLAACGGVQQSLSSFGSSQPESPKFPGMNTYKFALFCSNYCMLSLLE